MSRPGPDQGCPGGNVGNPQASISDPLSEGALRARRRAGSALIASASVLAA
jgi:hypothetical protein